MKINCGRSFEERGHYLSNWHPFYAILPRRVAPRDCRVFERIERRGRYNEGSGWDDNGGWVWSYRAIG